MTTLASRVVEDLRQSLLDGRLVPGDKLPSESALEKQFSVSRTVVREALSRLQTAGLVETYRGKGTFVLTRPSGQPFAVEPGEIRCHQDRLDLVDFRIGVETEIAALAARRHTVVELGAIEKALAAFGAIEQSPRAAVEADFAFHRSIAVAAHNRLYLDLVVSLGASMITMPQTRLVPENPESAASRFNVVSHEHLVIFAAIGDRDPQGAAAAMRTHLTNSRLRLASTTGQA
ncbi:FadR/GntR family transcriptional regulator [Arthrobacter sp. Sr33]